MQQQEEKTTANRFNYDRALAWLSEQGKALFGARFQLAAEDAEIHKRLLCYFLKDKSVADQYGIDLDKGLLVSGPIGCGKTSLMMILRLLLPAESRFIIKSCRDVSFEFNKEGYDTIQKYSRLSFKNHEPVVYCFDDLGTEKTLKHYGNECNIMAEVLLSRYDQFISRKLITHLTSNLSASEIEAFYGNRVRSRMRELFNLIAFEKASKDKRQ